MNVFMVSTGIDEMFEIDGMFSTLELADVRREELGYGDIAEYVVDANVGLKRLQFDDDGAVLKDHPDEGDFDEDDVILTEEEIADSIRPVWDDLDHECEAIAEMRKLNPEREIVR